MEIMQSGGELIRGCNEERIYVSVRLRPLSENEISTNDVSDWECINNDTIVHKNVHPSAYTFDRVFGSDCSTREVYEQGAKDVAISVARGMNSTIFAYGQTSSGKTYTMTGITEYAIADVYEYIQKHPEREFVLKFSAMEIYNESVYDLLSSDTTPLRLLDDPERGTIVEKLTEEILRDRDHVTQLLSICQAQRQIGETSLNEKSSRSHQIIRLTVESSSLELLGRNNPSTLAASVNFVDLAGSERASQSLSAGTRLKEGCHINRSLLTLGTVIRKLSKERNGHIPYRDSKLTRILQTSLGGNARTAIICTINPSRSHVEQSRNTLLFASCAKEVTTNARVNEVMSDEALVKHLQKEVTRLESQLRGCYPYFAPSNYFAIVREKDAQIEKLEKEVRSLILQRDIAQSQVKEFLRMLGDDASSMTQVEMTHYPHFRVQNSPDKLETSSILGDPNSDVDNITCSSRHSRSSSEDHFAKVPYFDGNFVQNYASPRVLLSSSNSSRRSDPYTGWDDIEKPRVEREESSNRGAIESNCSSSEEGGSPAVRVRVNGGWQDKESESPPSLIVKDQEFISSPSKNDNEVKKDNPSELISSNQGKEQISASIMDVKESISPVFKKDGDFSSIQYLDIASGEAKDSFGTRSLDLSRSKSCKASIGSDTDSPWLKTMEYSENKPGVGSQKESEWCIGKIYTLNFGSGDESLSRQDSRSIPVDIDSISIIPEMREKAELPTAQNITMKQEKEIAPEVNKSPKKEVEDIDEYKRLTSWPVEFKRLQREIIELWHFCNVSLVHRTYFFLLFQGDPSDAIYLQVEIRRMKFLKDTFSRGDKTLVKGKFLTLSSSAKALRQERRMLSEQMMKKFSEKEREILFVEWGIGLNTKMRRLQLANLVWAKSEDMNHITESAFLVAKLVGFIEPGQTPTKDMLRMNFAPKSSAGTCSFKQSLVSIL